MENTVCAGIGEFSGLQAVFHNFGRLGDTILTKGTGRSL